MLKEISMCAKYKKLNKKCMKAINMQKHLELSIKI